MNHQSAAAYAAQMEKIEQNITLCLQEIDHNFATCHRIVTTKLLPKVECYGDASKNVWNGSRFWKHFFEASANVSLSGYRDEEEDGDVTATMAKNPVTESYEQSPASPSLHGNIADDSFMASMSLGVKSSTPVGRETTWAEMPSPFEDMKKDLKENFDIESSISSSVRDLEKRHNQREVREVPASATSSVFSTKDKYASPVSSPVKPTPKGPPGSTTPHLLKQVLYKNLRENKTPRAARQAPSFKIADAAKTPSRFITPADIDDMEFPPGMSPPVTLQFSMPPSKLAKTPAKEAAQYLVRDILMTAGSPVPPTPESLLKDDEDNKRELFDMVEEDEDEEEPITMGGDANDHDDSFDIAVTDGIKNLRLSMGNSAFAPLEEDDDDDDDEPGQEDTLFGARPAARPIRPMTTTPLKFKAPDELLGEEQTGQFTDNIESPCPPALRGDL